MTTDRFYEFGLRWIETHGPSVLMAIPVFFLGQWLIGIFRKGLVRAMERKEVSVSLRPFLQSLVLTALQILLIVLVLQILSVHLTIFTAIVTSFGVAAGLALSGTLQNFTGGVLILLLKPFKVGDNIIAQGQDGIVTSIEIFFTSITTADNRTVIFPNSKLSNEMIINISRQGFRRLDIELKFSFGTNMEDVKRVLLKTAHEFPQILKSPAAHAGVSKLDPDGFRMTLQAWITNAQFHEIKFSLHQKVVENMKAAAIKLPGM
jgi:small conductance mechanosensitive channel